jgi:predicted DNA-binding transcriptional regulator AlpA
MIPFAKKITELTWGDVITEFDERYGKNASLQVIRANPVLPEFINIKECASLTGYSPGYIRQLIFKRAIPFHKNPKLKPVRFKRNEIVGWMATKKFEPINDMAESYLEGRDHFKKQKPKS